MLVAVIEWLFLVTHAGTSPITSVVLTYIVVNLEFFKASFLNVYYLRGTGLL